MRDRHTVIILNPKTPHKAPKFLFMLGVTLTLVGCISAADHSSQVHSNRAQEFTVGVVQREVRRGMSQSDVAVALGSPNIVTREDNGNETWIYDKIATEASQSSDSGGLWLLLGNYDKSAGASASTQKTLTVVIKFDRSSRVDSFTYHSTKF
jgi:outer membrane protein assembly factor BamE (lipoprotein component of BamABCDE complex)